MPVAGLHPQPPTSHVYFPVLQSITGMFLRGNPLPFHCPTQDIQPYGTSILTKTRLKTSRAAPKGVTKGSLQPLISVGRRRHRPSHNGRADKCTHPAPELSQLVNVTGVRNPLPAGRHTAGASQQCWAHWPLPTDCLWHGYQQQPPPLGSPWTSMSQPGKPLAWHSLL